MHFEKYLKIIKNAFKKFFKYLKIKIPLDNLIENYFKLY